MKLLVTGGSGFIGGNFIRTVLNSWDDVEVVNLDALTYAGVRESLSDLENDPRYTFVHGSICEASLVDRLVSECDAIVHFAAESHVDRSIAHAKDFIDTNIIGTFTLLDSARKYNKRFHHVSTDEVFGSLKPNDPSFNERTPYNPRSPYSASKASSDHLVMAYFHTYGLPVTMSNCSNNYGPYQFPEKLIPLAITNVLEGKSIPVYGNGEQVRDWLYVEDHCKAIMLILEKGVLGEVYCIGGASEKRNIDVVTSIASHFGKGAAALSFVTDRPGHDTRYSIAFNKIHEELGWSPSVTFGEGLGKTIEWYKDNQSWWKKLKK